MKAPAFSPRGNKPSGTTQRKPPVTANVLHQQYETATSAFFFQHFADIDAWLVDHEPDLWRQIHTEDEDLFRLRHLGVSESRYQGRLEVFLSLCEQAERLYYEAQPQGLSLPALAPGESLAIYYQLADGSLHRVSSEDGEK
jgi:hypothetical protein